MWTLLLLDDGTRVETRRMLAFSRWEIASDGQQLIDRLRGKAVA